MIIGVPKEIKTEEFRVGITPTGARELVRGEHRVIIEAGAGQGSGFSDEGEYRAAGAETASRDAVVGQSELIVKVKEPLPQEYGLLKEGVALFTYLHLAPNRSLTTVLLQKKITGLAYETLEKDGRLPLLIGLGQPAEFTLITRACGGQMTGNCWIKSCYAL